ncbi:hypothetical protein ALI22I_20985 [Saccharothrix sp. ALI-22-I]|uniref:LysR substrate-binding domain-containing protein n=1 Tax=Saccharothrix sp. ALI-22-I TaxID=1933778 RepID=UPI00097BBE15|nr:LysR substrate-binding domain-containing protein [Saccharothrix sp. ALI-22-I]ONI87684.1 hypothetical protein ALI22I_20985 [Saccharothrix sp. ALI-22-I]
MSPEEASGPEVRDGGQLMQLIALGQVVAVIPESARRQARSDVVCVPVLDAPRTSILLAWPERTRSRPVAAFVRASTEVAAGGRVIETAAAPWTRTTATGRLPDHRPPADLSK